MRLPLWATPRRLSPAPLPGEGRKKEYKLTPKGLEILKKELARLRELVASGDMVLKEEA